MEEINALTVRNKLGEVLDRLEKSGEPILISKGRKIKAVLVIPSQFERRFLDYQAEEKKGLLLKTINELRRPRTGRMTSLEALRTLRGYSS
jgi:antitoxin (DNA-binding transcriptional repressor) of toxin-antitoxin stability system